MTLSGTLFGLILGIPLRSDEGGRPYYLIVFTLVFLSIVAIVVYAKIQNRRSDKEYERIIREHTSK